MGIASPVSCGDSFINLDKTSFAWIICCSRAWQLFSGPFTHWWFAKNVGLYRG